MTTSLNMFNGLGDLVPDDSLSASRVLGDDTSIFEGVAHNSRDQNGAPISPIVSTFDSTEISNTENFPVLSAKVLSDSSFKFGWIGEDLIKQGTTTFHNLPLSLLGVCSCPACESAGGATPQEATIARPGDSRIDPLIGGYKWGASTLTYSFYSGGSYYGSEAGLATLSTVAKSNVRYILTNVIAPLINLTFTEVADSPTSYGLLRYLNSTTPGYAYAYYPSSTDTNQGNSNDLAGDVFFNSSYDRAGDTNGIQNGAGSHGYQTIIHETLHALGLKHPGNYNGSGAGDPPYIAYGEDNWDNTLMTYNFNSGAEPSTPMAYDVLALQYLYGAKSFNATNTIYTFSSADSYSDGSQSVGSTTLDNKVTIWDSAGTDTLNYASAISSTSGYRFDMNAGGWLSTQAAFNASKYNVNVGPPVSYVGGTTYSATTFGTRLAYGVTIENLVNSSSNDYIIANSVANVFSGYGAVTTTGADTIEGANNLDTLDLSAFTSASVTQTQTGNNLVLGLGSGRTVTIKDYYAVAVGSRINLQFAAVSQTLAIAKTTDGSETGATSSVFTLTRTGSTTAALNVTYALTGTATVVSDYTNSSNGTATFAAGAATTTISLPTIDDAVVDPNETIIATITAPTGYTISGSNNATATIIDNDLGTIAIAKTTDGSETGATSSVFTLTRTGSTTAALNVTYALTGTATVVSDYTNPSNGTATFAAGAATTTISLPTVDDAIVDPNETIIATITAPTGYTISGSNNATATIADNDLGTIAIAKTTDGSENGTASLFTLTRTGSTTAALNVAYALTGTATVVSDYTNPSAGTATFAAGVTTTTISLPTVNDAVVDPNETIIATITAPTGYTISGSNNATATIADNDLGTIAIAKTADGSETGATSSVFTLTRTGSTSAALNVTYALTGTATVVSDYTNPSNGTATFAAGAATTTISLPTIDDAVVDPNETIIATITAPTGYTISGSNNATATIADNDQSTTTLAVSVLNANKREGNTGSTPFTFAVTRTGNLSGTTTVDYTVAGNATNPANAADFGGTLPSGTVTFAPTETSKVVTVNVVGDTVVETDENFVVTLANPSSPATITTASAAGVIFNDDLINLAIAATDANKNEGNSGLTPFTFTVTRIGDLTSTSTVNYSVTGSGANTANATDLNGVLPSGTVTFAANETSKLVTINVSGDTVIEPNEEFTVTLFSPSSSATITTATATGLILNDDATTLAIAATDANKNEGNSGLTPFTFTVTRIGDISIASTVNYAVTGSGTNPVNASDFGGTLPAGIVSFAANETSKLVTVNVSGNRVFESAEGFTITLSNPSSPTTITTASTTGTILNDDRFVRSDFNGDANADIFWRDPISGGNIIWNMDGAATLNSTATSDGNTNFSVQKTGDLNGDGKADIFWRDPVTGTNVVWLMNNFAIIDSDYTTAAPANFTLEAVGDFFGNGKSSILWRDRTAGSTALWQMDGKNLVNGFSMTSPTPNWVIAGTGDFNGDGKTDIFWRDPITGSNAIWNMDGADILNAAIIGNGNTNFSVQKTGDFNGDGKADIFWRDPVSGGNVIWLMNNFAIANGEYTAAAATKFTLEDVADYYGTGKSALLWRDRTSGFTAIWQMDGTNLVSGTQTASLAPNFQVTGLS